MASFGRDVSQENRDRLSPKLGGLLFTRTTGVELPLEQLNQKNTGVCGRVAVLKGAHG